MFHVISKSHVYRDNRKNKVKTFIYISVLLRQAKTVFPVDAIPIYRRVQLALDTMFFRPLGNEHQCNETVFND